ncbi:MAG: hypothetical protein ACK5UN_01980, partial [Planctomycetota bacterium]
MAGHSSPTAMLGLALSMSLLCIVACKPKEAPPDFLNKTASSSKAKEKNESRPLDRAMPEGTSAID